MKLSKFFVSSHWQSAATARWSHLGAIIYATSKAEASGVHIEDCNKKLGDGWALLSIINLPADEEALCENK